MHLAKTLRAIHVVADRPTLPLSGRLVSFLHVFALNTTIVFTCIIMAVYYPAVSTVLRYAL